MESILIITESLFNFYDRTQDLSVLTCFLVAVPAAGGRTRQRRKAGRWLSAAAGLQSAAGSAPRALGCTETRPPVPEVRFRRDLTSPSPPQASYPSAAGRRARRPGSEPCLCCQTLSCPPARHIKTDPVSTKQLSNFIVLEPHNRVYLVSPLFCSGLLSNVYIRHVKAASSSVRS